MKTIKLIALGLGFLSLISCEKDSLFDSFTGIKNDTIIQTEYDSILIPKIIVYPQEIELVTDKDTSFTIYITLVNCDMDVRIITNNFRFLASEYNLCASSMDTTIRFFYIPNVKSNQTLPVKLKYRYQEEHKGKIIKEVLKIGDYQLSSFAEYSIAVY